MLLKKEDYSESPITPFDLLGYDEKGLSKAFAFLLAKEKDTLYHFLKHVGVTVNNTASNFQRTSIIVEKKRKEGRTDIEIFQPRRFHVIIEAKIRSNKVRDQRTQYIGSFSDVPQKCLCFITQVNDYKKAIMRGLTVRNIGWLEIANLFDEKRFYTKKIVADFLAFINRGYKMRNQREILVQDVSLKKEMRQYREFNIYRRDVVFGSPLYFSPYFTSKAKQPEGKGFSFLSKVLGILTAKPSDVLALRDDLLRFSNEDELLVQKWIEGVKLDLKKGENLQTYFFLDNPVRLEKPLLKDGTRRKGRGKNWVAAMIPRNRCVTFEEFVKRMSSQ